jgi:hypothetical protein
MDSGNADASMGLRFWSGIGLLVLVTIFLSWLIVHFAVA